MTYTDRYHLTPEQSRFLAKKKWDENVYCGMKMENRAVTFPQTKTILEGVNVPGVQIDDIQAILNMRDAWRFLIGSIDEDVTLEYVCKLNGFIARNEALEWASCAREAWPSPVRTTRRLCRRKRLSGQSWPRSLPPMPRPRKRR